MEYIDVLDEKGNKTGEVKSKDEVHEKGLWHRAVHIWILNSKNEILLQLRSKNLVSSPGKWDISAAGHISEGEESLISAERELFEELGVKIPIESFILLGHVTQSAIKNNGTYINNEFNDVYLIRSDLKIEDFKFNDGEVEKVEYVPLETFKQWVQDKRADIVQRPDEFELLFSYLK